MRRLVDILLFVTLMMVTSCRELPDYLVGDDTIARVGRNELTVADMADVIPANLKGEDSVVFVKQYVDKWIVRQLKVEEADRLFSGSEKDIEKLVEDYRQSLLTGKVDQYYVDQQKGGEFTDEDIAEYYNTHKSDFVLDRTLVKGRIVGFPASYRQSKKLMEQMRKAATSQSDDKTFSEVCEKNGFQVVDNRAEWVNFADFLANLPTTRSQEYDHLLDKLGIQEMKANDVRYYFDFTSVCRKGNVAPLELVSENIRRIL
ncbi:MAG: hypothetical protein IKJ48_02310, partial [Alistipes sp.]|nr:hypothetical protein [Alistipes sp.]